MKIWKKNLVAAALLVTVCIGIYANWSYTQDQQTMDLTDTLNEEKILSEDMLVMADSEETEDITNTVSDYFSAVVEIIPLQLLAYYIARERGCDIDKPKNLAKSVTVE